MRFRYTSTNCPNPQELEFITGREHPVPHDTFKRNIGNVEYDRLRELLGYSKTNPLKDDTNMTYHKSKTPYGKLVYYIQHAAIKYVYY